MVKDYLGKKVRVVVDRPLGTKHPRYPDKGAYPVNYGYVPGTKTGDGKEQDVFLLGVDEPVSEYEGECIAVVHRKDDDEDKLVVVPEGVEMTDEEIMKAVEFQERYFDSRVVRGASAIGYK
jgi:inorganic pyrophosphatase